MCGGQRTNSGVGLKLLLLEIGSFIGLQLYLVGQTGSFGDLPVSPLIPPNGGDYRCPAFLQRFGAPNSGLHTCGGTRLQAAPSPQVGSFTLAVSNEHRDRK